MLTLVKNLNKERKLCERDAQIVVPLVENESETWETKRRTLTVWLGASVASNSPTLFQQQLELKY